MLWRNSTKQSTKVLSPLSKASEEGKELAPTGPEEVLSSSSSRVIDENQMRSYHPHPSAHLGTLHPLHLRPGSGHTCRLHVWLSSSCLAFLHLPTTSHSVAAKLCHSTMLRLWPWMPLLIHSNPNWP